MNNKMLEIVQGGYAVCTVDNVVHAKGFMFADWHGGKTFLHIRQGKAIVVSEGRIVFADSMMPVPPVGARLVAILDRDEQGRSVAVVWGSEREYLECLEWARHNSIKIPVVIKGDSAKAAPLPKPAPSVQIPAKPEAVVHEAKRHVKVPRRTPRIMTDKVVQFPQDTMLGKAMEVESDQKKTAS